MVLGSITSLHHWMWTTQLCNLQPNKPNMQNAIHGFGNLCSKISQREMIWNEWSNIPQSKQPRYWMMSWVGAFLHSRCVLIYILIYNWVNWCTDLKLELWFEILLVPGHWLFEPLAFGPLAVWAIDYWLRLVCLVCLLCGCLFFEPLLGASSPKKSVANHLNCLLLYTLQIKKS